MFIVNVDVSPLNLFLNFFLVRLVLFFFFSTMPVLLLFYLTCFSNLFDCNRYVALVISFVYLCLLYGLYVPDWEYQIQTEPSSEPKTFSVSIDVLYCFKFTRMNLTSSIGFKRNKCDLLG